MARSKNSFKVYLPAPRVSSIVGRVRREVGEARVIAGDYSDLYNLDGELVGFQLIDRRAVVQRGLNENVRKPG